MVPHGVSDAERGIHPCGEELVVSGAHLGTTNRRGTSTFLVRHDWQMTVVDEKKRGTRRMRDSAVGF